MGRSLIILFLFLINQPFCVTGQCPEQQILKGRQAYLKDSSRLPITAQLSSLLQYESLASRCNDPRDSVRILVLQRLASLYESNYQFEYAISCSQKAIRLVNTHFTDRTLNPVHQIRNYYNLGNSYELLKKTTEQFRAFDSCVAVALRTNVVTIHSMYALLAQVKHLNSIGDYKSCISKADLGAALTHHFIPDKRLASEDSTDYNFHFAVEKSNALLVLQDYNHAEKFLLAKIKSCERSHSQGFLGTFYEQLAMTKMHQHVFDKAMEYFNRALKFHLSRKDISNYKTTVHNIGYYRYTKIKGYENDSMALIYYRKALNCTIPETNDDDKKVDSINVLNIYVSIANAYARQRRFDSAQFYFSKAFGQFKMHADEEVVLNSSPDEFNEKVEYFTNLFIDKAGAYLAEFNVTKKKSTIDEAIRVFKCTDRLLERIKRNQLELQSKLFWRINTHHFYEQALEACMSSGNLKDAFYFFERSRSILLVDQMYEQSTMVQKDILGKRELMEAMNRMQIGLAVLDPDSEEYGVRHLEFMKLKDRQDKFNQKIKEKNLLYYQNFIDSNSTSLTEVRKNILKYHKALLEMFEGDSAVYAMIVTSSAIFFNRIDKASYDKTMKLCVAYLANSKLSNSENDFDEFKKNALYLYNLIFQDKKIPDGRIVISTDGHTFPFEVLVTGMDNKEPVYFLQNHAVSYTYSARYLMSQFTGKPSSDRKDFLGIAPVKFPVKETLPSLMGSDEAVLADRQLFQESDMLVMGEATKANFIKKFSHYQILQLYSHSSDSSAKGEPLIYFADQPLYMSELSYMETPDTKLVVLSACKTGNGQYYQGEGVFSFNRAFAGLGIPSCINNLWSVDNESTYSITHMFYENLGKGMAIDEALQQAKLNFIKLNSSGRKRHPYYWAATILAGKSDAIPLKENHLHKILTIALAVAAFIALAWPLTNFINRSIKRRSPGFNKT